MITIGIDSVHPRLMSWLQYTLESVEEDLQIYTHHGPRKVADRLVRGNHIIWTQNKVTKGTYPQTRHSEIKDKTVCQAMIDQRWVFCQNSAVFAAPPPGTSFNQRPCPPMAN